MPASAPSHVWYACYGSNLSLARFRCYIDGGIPEGSTKCNRGSSDRTPISASRGGSVAGFQLLFARESRSWADRDDNNVITRIGGVAFIARDPGASLRVRCYRLTPQQFKDVFEQENSDRATLPTDWLTLTPGAHIDADTIAKPDPWYRRLIRLPDIEGEPTFTFTDPKLDPQSPSSPSLAYLRTIIRGMAETFDPTERGPLIDYLRACPGLSADQSLGDQLPAIFSEISGGPGPPLSRIGSEE